MNSLLWVTQGILSGVFLATGLMKLIVPKEKLIDRLRPLAPIPAPLLKVLGATEVLGAAGISLPQLLEAAPGPVVLAALGLSLIMVGATAVQARDRNWPMVGVNLLLLGLSLFVAYGRWYGMGGTPAPLM